MKHLFIPYKLAVLAKNKGFNEECIKRYSGGGNLSKLAQFPENFNTPLWDPSISAPMYQQIIDWFREKYEYYIWVEEEGKGNDFYYKIKIPQGTHESGYHNSYYFALDDAIEEAFKLI